MNYEEKYKEILEWARKNKARLNGVPIEEVLPELKESEYDEFSKIWNLVYKAIRKVLANFGVYSEDEELLDSREESIDYYSQRCAEEILKSLRPSWKPSEEQMMALLNTLHPDDPYYHDLKSLYEQLKKL